MLIHRRIVHFEEVSQPLRGVGYFFRRQYYFFAYRTNEFILGKVVVLFVVVKHPHSQYERVGSIRTSSEQLADGFLVWSTCAPRILGGQDGSPFTVKAERQDIEFRA